MKKLARFLVLIFFATLFTRLFLINQFPIGVTHDELNYILAAKSINQTGKFVPGTAPAIINTSMSHFDIVIAEVPAYILSIFEFIGINARQVGGVFSALGAVLLYILVLKLFDNVPLAAICSALFIINPWNFLIGRTAFETNYVIFFFLLGLIFLLVLKGKKTFLALVPFILGFFSYTGGQISFYLFILAALVFACSKNKSDRKYYLYFLVVITLVFFSYVFRTITNQSFSSRSGELFLPTSWEVSSLVDAERLVTAPSRLNSLFINKATVWVKGAIERYLGAFSVDRLFVNGEFRAAFSLQKHGNFYVVDFAFIILGISYLYKKHKSKWLLLLSLILVAPVTAIFSSIEFSYTQRAALMYPFLIIFAAAGIYAFVDKAPKKKLTTFGVVFVYLLFFANMLHLYFFRFPVYASDGWFFQDRVLARYIELINRGEEEVSVVVVSSEPKIIFEEYLYYTNHYQGKLIKEINKSLDKKRYEFRNVNFTSSCPESLGKKVVVIDPETNCDLTDKSRALRITRYKDVAEEYLIFNDQLCKDFELSGFVHPSAFKNFNVESQSTKEFCQNWITKI